MITEFEKGQWSVIQNVITFMKDDQTAMSFVEKLVLARRRFLNWKRIHVHL